MQPRPAAPGGEDDGLVIAMCSNDASGKGEVVVLDAKYIEKGPLCAWSTRGRVPLGLHNLWEPQDLSAHDRG